MKEDRRLVCRKRRREHGAPFHIEGPHDSAGVVLAGRINEGRGLSDGVWADGLITAYLRDVPFAARCCIVGVRFG
jgi:hypothetical protein